MQRKAKIHPRTNWSIAKSILPIGAGVNSIILVIAAIGLFCPQRGLPYGIEEEAKLETSTVINPYSYLPMELRRPASRTDTMKPSLLAVAPQRPAIVTDADGFKSLYSSQGKLLAKLDPETGKVTYYMGNMPRFEKDKSGKAIRKYVYHSPRASIENEFGETIGYQSYGKGGLLLQEEDEKARITRRYEYDGRRLTASLDLLTNTRTVYNERGKPDREFNFQTAALTQYSYNGGKLSSKIDNYGNKTIYQDDGKKEKAAYDAQGNLIKTYEWLSSDSYKVTDQYGNTTYVAQERQQYTTNYTGTKTKTWDWQGTKLLSTTDLFKEEITYYENGRPTETRYNGFLVGLWKYEAGTGILVSSTDREKTTYYDHGREGITILDTTFALETLTRDYKPLFFDQIRDIILKYKDASQSIMPDVEKLLPPSHPSV